VDGLLENNSLVEVLTTDVDVALSREMMWDDIRLDEIASEYIRLYEDGMGRHENGT
jgi:hypothetical protein